MHKGAQPHTSLQLAATLPLRQTDTVTLPLAAARLVTDTARAAAEVPACSPLRVCCDRCHVAGAAAGRPGGGPQQVGLAVVGLRPLLIHDSPAAAVLLEGLPVAVEVWVPWVAADGRVTRRGLEAHWPALQQLYSTGAASLSAWHPQLQVLFRPGRQLPQTQKFRAPAQRC